MAKYEADPFSENIIASIPLAVRQTFTGPQLHAIRKALSMAHDRSRHKIDLRITIPLYFVRYYVVFLFGKDLRRGTRRVSLERRKDSSQAAGFALIIAMIGNIILLAGGALFILLYLIKSALGINLFADLHLWDLF